MTRYAQTLRSRQSDSGSAPGASSPMDWVSATVRNKPEALLLLAAGCALMIGAGRSVVKSSPPSGLRRSGVDAWNAPGAANAAGVADRISSFGSQAAGAAADKAASYAGSLSDAASSYAGAVSDYAQSAGQGVADRSGRLLSQTQSSLEAGLDYLIHEQPLMLAALGLAAGAAIGAALPATDVENRALGETRDQLAQAATHAAGDQLSRLKNVAGTVGEKVKEAATHHGQDFAHEVTDAVKDAATAAQGQGSAQTESQNKDKPQNLSSSAPGQSHAPAPAANAPQGQKDSSGRSPAQGGGQSSTSGVKTN